MAIKQTPLRNKEQSKQRFLDAVGEILKKEGSAALKVNHIAEVAGLDKKMMYNYFGGLNGLIDDYLKSVDFWSNVKTEGIINPNDGGQGLSKELLLKQFDAIAKSQELRQVLLWGITEHRDALTHMNDTREEIGEQLFKNVTDPFFGPNAEEYRAITALLVSGIYYMNMFTGINGNHFCGIDVSQEDGKVAIKNAMAKIIDLVYQEAR